MGAPLLVSTEHHPSGSRSACHQSVAPAAVSKQTPSASATSCPCQVARCPVSATPARTSAGSAGNTSSWPATVGHEVEGGSGMMRWVPGIRKFCSGAQFFGISSRTGPVRVQERGAPAWQRAPRRAASSGTRGVPRSCWSARSQRDGLPLPLSHGVLPSNSISALRRTPANAVSHISHAAPAWATSAAAHRCWRRPGRHRAALREPAQRRAGREARSPPPGLSAVAAPSLAVLMPARERAAAADESGSGGHHASPHHFRTQRMGMLV